MREQPALPREPAAIAGQGAVGADDAVAGDDDADRVRAVRQAHGAHRAGTTDLPRERAIGERLAAGDGAERAPDRLLEGCAADRDGKIVDRVELAREIR